MISLFAIQLSYLLSCLRQSKMSKDSKLISATFTQETKVDKGKIMFTVSPKGQYRMLKKHAESLTEDKIGVNVFILMCIKVRIKSAASSNFNIRLNFVPGVDVTL